MIYARNPDMVIPLGLTGRGQLDDEDLWDLLLQALIVVRTVGREVPGAVQVFELVGPDDYNSMTGEHYPGVHAQRASLRGILDEFHSLLHQLDDFEVQPGAHREIKFSGRDEYGISTYDLAPELRGFAADYYRNSRPVLENWRINARWIQP